MNNEIMKKFIELKDMIIQDYISGTTIPDNTIIDGIDMVLEAFAERKRPSGIFVDLKKIHNTLMLLKFYGAK